MDDKCDPLNGWPPLEVHQWPALAKADCYGKLFAYLTRQFTTFLEKYQVIDIEFTMYCTDAIELHKTLRMGTYMRIEVTLKVGIAVARGYQV